MPKSNSCLSKKEQEEIAKRQKLAQQPARPVTTEAEELEKEKIRMKSINPFADNTAEVEIEPIKKRELAPKEGEIAEDNEERRLMEQKLKADQIIICNAGKMQYCDVFRQMQTFDDVFEIDFKVKPATWTVKVLTKVPVNDSIKKEENSITENVKYEIKPMILKHCPQCGGNLTFSECYQNKGLK